MSAGPRGRPGELFDPDEVFGEDYLFFSAASLDDARSDEDLSIIVERSGTPRGARVLDAPCGAGRIAVRLAAMGATVTGVDRSARCLELAAVAARARGVDVELIAGDLRRLPVDGPFDVVVCWFTSFGYFEDEENLEVLREFRRVLRPGGWLVLETLSHDGYVRTFTESPEAVVVEVGPDLLVDRNTFDVDAGRLVCRRTTLRAGERRETQFAIRLLTVPEWREWLGAAGFRSVEVTDHAGERLGVSTWRLVVRATV